MEKTSNQPHFPQLLSLMLLSEGGNTNIFSPPAVDLEAACMPKKFEESQQSVKTEDQERAPCAALRVKGTKLETLPNLKSSKVSLSLPKKSKVLPKMTKIRNYNVKD